MMPETQNMELPAALNNVYEMGIDDISINIHWVQEIKKNKTVFEKEFENQDSEITIYYSNGQAGDPNNGIEISSNLKLAPINLFSFIEAITHQLEEDIIIGFCNDILDAEIDLDFGLRQVLQTMNYLIEHFELAEILNH